MLSSLEFTFWKCFLEVKVYFLASRAVAVFSQYSIKKTKIDDRDYVIRIPALVSSFPGFLRSSRPRISKESRADPRTRRNVKQLAHFSIEGLLINNMNDDDDDDDGNNRTARSPARIVSIHVTNCRIITLEGSWLLLFKVVEVGTATRCEEIFPKGGESN